MFTRIQKFARVNYSIEFLLDRIVNENHKYKIRC